MAVFWRAPKKSLFLLLNLRGFTFDETVLNLTLRNRCNTIASATPWSECNHSSINTCLHCLSSRTLHSDDNGVGIDWKWLHSVRLQEFRTSVQSREIHDFSASPLPQKEQAGHECLGWLNCQKSRERREQEEFRFKRGKPHSFLAAPKLIETFL